MRDGDADMRQHARHAQRDAVNRLDVVMHEKDLPAAIQLPRNRLVNHVVVELHDIRAHREAAFRRRFDDAQIADAHQRHVQRARNRRRRERQHVHERPVLPDFFLVRHAETLLFVNNHQPQIFEPDVFLQQAVRADHDVHRAGFQASDNLLLLFFRFKSVQHADSNGEFGEAFRKGLRMLLRENRRRHKHGDLLAVQHGAKRRPHGDFGFAVADIAADQPIHRLRRGHVARHVLNRFVLIRRLFVLERRLKFAVQVFVRREHHARQRLPRRIRVEQFPRHFLDGRLDALFHPRPACAAQFVYFRAMLVCAQIFLHQIEPIHRHVELVAAAVFQMQAFHRHGLHGQLFQAEIDADAVIHMHHVIVDVKLAERHLRLDLFGLNMAAAHGLLAEKFVFVQENQAFLRQQKAAVQRADDNHGFRRLPENGRTGILACLHLRKNPRRDAIVAQNFPEALGLMFRIRRDNYGMPVFEPFADAPGNRGDMVIFVRRFLLVRHERSRPFQRFGREIEHRLRRRGIVPFARKHVELRPRLGLFCGRTRRNIGGRLTDIQKLQRDLPPRREPRLKGVRRQKHAFRRGQRIPFFFGQAILLLRGRREFLARFADFRRFIQQHKRVRREIIEQAFQFAVKIGGVPLDAGEKDFFVKMRRQRAQRVQRRPDFRDAAVKIGFRGGARRIGHHKLAPRQNRNQVKRRQGTLRRRIEFAQRFHRIAEKFDAKRAVAERRKQIEDAAANAEFAATFDKMRVFVAGIHQHRRQLLAV